MSGSTHETGARARDDGRPAPSESGRRVPLRVWRGTLLLVVGRMWGSACTLVTWLLLSRHLDAGDFGRFTFYLSIFVVLDTWIDFGTGQVAVQQSAHDEDRIPEVLAAARRVRVSMGCIGAALVGGGALLLGERGALWIALASLYPLTHALELSTLALKNRIAWGIPVAVRACAAATSLAFVLLLRASGDREPAHYLFAIACGSTLGNFAQHAFAAPHLPKRRARSIEAWSLFQAALPLGVASLCQQAYFYVDNLFVRPICGEVELGRYNTGVRVMSYGIMVAIYATQAALPWLARAHARGELAVATAKLGQPLSAVAAFGLGLAWPWTGEILALFHPDFADAATSLRWLLAATAAVYLGACLMTALVAAGGRHAILLIAAVALGVNLAANTWLVPRLGIDGAALATLATEVCVVLGAALALARLGAAPWSAPRAWSWLAPVIAFPAAALISTVARGWA